MHVGYLDTDMAANVDGPKTDPADLARQVLDAVRRAPTRCWATTSAAA